MSTRSEEPILIVDDEQQALDVMRVVLSEVSFAVLATTSPEEAIAVMRDRKIALLICDMYMPGMDGTAVLAAARRCNRDVVSILVTGGTPDKDATMRAINEGGIWKFLAKPWQPEQLIALAREGLRRYEDTLALRKRMEAFHRADMIKTTPTAARARKPAVVIAKWPGETGPHLVVKKDTFRKVRQQRETFRKDVGIFLGSRYANPVLLGEGAMSCVYKVVDAFLGMTVAVKVLSPDLLKNAKMVELLKQEARILMQFSHRHIVKLYNLDVIQGSYFMVMEYVSGCTFREILKTYGRLSLDTVQRVAEVCSDALGYAHRHGVLHRDLKPENLMLSDDGVLKIIDFGVSCLKESAPESGFLVGTPQYMSPEQIMGTFLDERSDVYSVGAILGEMIGGTPLFPHQDLNEILNAEPDLSGIPDAIQPVIAKAVAKDAEQRWPSVQHVSAALESVVGERPPE